jgi:hypothetical protein
MMSKDGSNHAKRSDGEGERKSKGEASDMFDLKEFEKLMTRDERLDVQSGLSRFKKETGVDFFDLLNDKQLRAKVLVENSSADTDEDEREIQKFFEPLQKKLFRKE